MVQVPELIKDAVVPDTVQTDVVVEVKVTGKPELAEAARERLVPATWAAIAGNVMV
jgi:hypothetical protein